MSVAIASPRPPRLSPYQRAVVRVALNILALLVVFFLAALAVAEPPVSAVGEVPPCI